MGIHVSEMCGAKNAVKIAFVGDVMLGRGVNEEIAQRPSEYFWGDALPALRSADAVVANLECAITARKRRWQKTPKAFYFRADPAAANVLKVANIRCVSLANNHTLDYEEEGLVDTLNNLDSAGIARAGAGRNRAEAEAPAVIEVKGLRVGFIAMTDNEPSFAAGPDRPGTNYLEIEVNEETRGFLFREISEARRLGADLVVLSLHWGPNMVISPPPHFRDFARMAVDLGVDVVHGHSAHVFQAVQKLGRGLVMFDTGDFLDDYAVDPILRNDWSFIFLVEADREGVKRLRMVPVRLTYARVDLAAGQEFEEIRLRMKMLCEEFEAPVFDVAEGLELMIR